jgi:hypothetical protein
MKRSTLRTCPVLDSARQRAGQRRLHAMRSDRAAITVDAHADACCGLSTADARSAHRIAMARFRTPIGAAPMRAVAQEVWP